MKPKELIEAVLKGKSASDVVVNEIEVTKDSNGDRITITDKKTGAARKAVEKHFKALGAELDKLGIEFTARVNDNYASIDIGR